MGTTALTLAVCFGGSRKSGAGAVEYQMWDASQLPTYEVCAKAFRAKIGTKVNITQITWGDYWTKLTIGFIAGTGSDVLIDHISKFAQFADLEALVPLEKQAAWAGVDESVFQENLVDLWEGEDGYQYGCPRDWDTVVVFHNRDILAQVGPSEADLADQSRNPVDGGTFKKVFIRLTVDKNGMRGDEPGFDKDHVAVYDLGIQDVGTGDGQTRWSPFAGSADDWLYTNKETWGDHYRYDEKVFQDTMDWYFGLADKGYIPPRGAFSFTTSTDVQLDNGKIAMCLNGLWMSGTYARLDVKVGIAANLAGPNDKSVSLFNGPGDSISKQSTNIDNTSKRMTLSGTTEVQDIVASYGIVFPAIVSSTKKAVKVFEETGLPTKPLTQHLENKSTFSFPLTHFGVDVGVTMRPTTDDLWANRVPASTLTKCNEQANLLFKTSKHKKG